MNETSILRRYLRKGGPYLRGIGDTQSKNETPSKDIREPVMRLESRKRVSGGNRPVQRRRAHRRACRRHDGFD